MTPYPLAQTNRIKACRLGWLLLLVVACAFHMTSAAPARAQDLTDPLPPHAQEFASVLVELDAPSSAEVYITGMEAAQAAAGNETAQAAALQQIAAMTQAQIVAVAAQQDAIAAELATLGAVEIYRVQRIYNGIAVRVPASQVNALRALPAVRAIHPMLPKSVDNTRSVPHIGAPQLWAGAAGMPLTGANIRIGIIDTGVDYLHVGLGGPGTGYAANDTTVILDVPGFPNLRVVGGYDFAGDAYDPHDMENYLPVPDPDPMDCYGHGTHVAASAAGSGITQAGREFKGPYTTTVPFGSLRLGPGVAPQADIYALRVFGCSGSTLLVDQAIDWAIDPNGDGDFGDHLDVINLSLGSPFGSASDTTTLASERAARMGIIVVAAAGNTGAALYSTSSPGVGERTISVAATIVEQPATEGAPTETDTIATFSARGVRLGDNRLKPDISAPGRQILSAASGTGNQVVEFNGTSMATPMVAGALALLRQLHPDWSVEELKALLMNTAVVVRSAPAYTSGLQPPMRAGAGRIDLTAAISATTIAYSLDDAGSVSLSFGAPEVLDTSSARKNVRLRNSSDSPATYILDYQPVTDATGVEIVAPPTVTVAAQGSATFPVQMRADAALMTNQRDPTLAAQNAEGGHFRSEEAGYLWLWPQDGLLRAQLAGVAATPPTTSTAHATFDATFNPITRELTWTLAATGLDASTVTRIDLTRGVAGEPAAELAHTLFARTGGVSVTLPLTGVVQLQAADAALLASGYLQAVVRTDTHPDGAIAGALRALSPVLKLPVHGAPRAVAEMRATVSALDFGDAASATRAITLTGAPLTGTLFPTHTQSLVSVFELHGRSPLASFGDLTASVGYADIRYVGVSSDWNRVANKADANVYFAIATWGKWSTPSQVMFEVWIDSNRDDVHDYRIYTSNMQSLIGAASTSEIFVAVVEDLATGSLSDPTLINALPASERLTALYENDVLFLSVPAAAIGLSASHSAFGFDVRSESLTASLFESGDWLFGMRYDMRRPGIQILNAQAGTPLFVDAPGTAIQLAYNQVNYARSTAQGVLLLHHHNGAGQNGAGARAEVVDVRYRWQYNLMLPLVSHFPIEAEH